MSIFYYNTRDKIALWFTIASLLALAVTAIIKFTVEQSSGTPATEYTTDNLQDALKHDREMATVPPVRATVPPAAPLPPVSPDRTTPNPARHDVSPASRSFPQQRPPAIPASGAAPKGQR
jgi:hypothetical protein